MASMPARPAKRRTASKTLPPGLRSSNEQRIVRYATQHHGGKFTRLDVRFRGAYCYVDFYCDEPELPAGYEPPNRGNR